MSDIVSEITETPEPSSPAPIKRSRRALYFKIAKWVVLTGFVFGVIVAIALTIWTIRATKDLPSVQALSEYKPAIMSRVHAGDGKLISEFRTEARVFVPIVSVPTRLQQAFVASEDKRFYTHNGWDPIGLTRAALTAPGKKLSGQRIGGTSTITQQVAKNFLVGDDYSMKRKVREIFIARRMEKAFEKGDILELYLNDNYFGRGAYGVAAAALNHFGKEMDDLTIGEMAYLALVVKGPANYELDNPKEYAAARSRQQYVLNRMAEDGYITQVEADEAFAAPLEWTDRLNGAEYLAAEYFVEEARKQIFAMYGSEELYSGGLSIRTTLDTDMQLAGRRALRRGLEMLDRRMGWRGPLATFETMDSWNEQLAAFAAPKDIGDWRVAVVLERDSTTAKLGLIKGAEDSDVAEEVDGPADTDVAAELATETGQLALEDVAWAGKALNNGVRGAPPKSLNSVISVGDVILVEAHTTKVGAYNLRQVPDVNGALIAMDPHTGRVKALIGGYSFEQSQFNRVTQAYRQPGSSFKPFVYASALLEGFTPASQVLDAPFVIERSDSDCEVNELGVLELRDTGEDRSEGQTTQPALRDQCERFYKPENYDAGRYYGLSTLRLGIEKSRNAMTVRLANDIGMAPIMRTSRRFGIYDNPLPELAWALGAGETNLLRLATAYSMMINGGKQIVPSILDRVQDGQGKTIFLNGDVTCPECQQKDYTGQAPPVLPDDREQVIDPITAYQVTYMMIGAVENGTGAKLRALGRPVGGKTGTTNDSKDNWFMAFTPDLVVGVYVGKDTPQQMGYETGSSSAAPIVLDFMTEVLENEPMVPFRIPDGLTLAPVNRDTGEPSFIGAPNVILEAFRPGTEPKVGSLDRTIRIGSGSDTFGSGFFGSGPKRLDDTIPPGLGEEPPFPTDDPVLNPLDLPTDTPVKTPDPEPEEDLDDGLY
ncbi:penicillin-binding protein [Algimonas arctica]|uniref:Penicillin-binding protein 1A n=1 Tax=Algimonas arctica TaxID=1479486 RepID=A0A8J3CPD7_9PROT|nr:transglycosylase domain-containing protein [Algimonas arctica]GHA91190.1 penicillin-binding protein [Algimonas arctica]